MPRKPTPFFGLKTNTKHEHKFWQEQRRKVQLEALSALFQLVQYMPEAFMEADGNSTVLQLLQATRSREVQKKSLHLLQVGIGGWWISALCW